jgi:hypothetical protein
MRESEREEERTNKKNIEKREIGKEPKRKTIKETKRERSIEKRDVDRDGPMSHVRFPADSS